MAGRKAKVQKTRPWTPMQQGDIDPTYMERAFPNGLPEHVDRVEVWANDVYEVTVSVWKNGCAYITGKRHDRAPARDWRHLQAIKNEVRGAEIEAVELFPAESRLVDEANQFHLWALPPGESWPFGQSTSVLGDARKMREHNQEERAAGMPGKGRQRDWQPGLSTGLSFERAAR